MSEEDKDFLDKLGNINLEFSKKDFTRLKRIRLCDHCNIFFSSKQAVNTHIQKIMDSKKRSFEEQIEEFRVVKARDISPEDLV